LLHGSIFFSQRVVKHWTSVCRNVVQPISVTSLKRQLYKMLALKSLPNRLIDVKLKPNLEKTNE